MAGKDQEIPLANLDDELRDSRDLTQGDPDEEAEKADALKELLPLSKGGLHQPGHGRSPDSHVTFGGEPKSQSAPSSPVDKVRPTRQRWLTHGLPSGPGRERRRRISRQLSGQLQRSTSYTLGRMRHVSERTFSAIDPGDENPERGTWNSQIEFFLSCLGYAVGLGNVWRFPYLCHKNGGGAFLIPYVIMLVFCGIPILMLELSLGQYASEGPITVWKISPIFKGIGCGMVLISVYLAIYYNMITGWAVYYIYQSMTTQLPWRCCGEKWSTAACTATDPNCAPHPNASSTLTAYSAATNISSSIYDSVSANASWSNLTHPAFRTPLKFPSDDFFHNVVLCLSDSINNIGPVKLHLAIVLFIAWVVVFLVLMRGIKSFGKAVYFTSIFPYVILFILLIRAAIEPGALKGVKYFVTPKWERLADAKVWGDAVTQIFFSTSICTGGVITLASYNRFKNNCFRDALVIGLGNSLTSLFSGFVVFSILGFMAHQQNAEIEDIVKGGPGLTFIVYPQAVTILPGAPVWSALFFVMLVTLALSSMFPTVENVTTALIDQFKILRPYKFWVTFVTCMVLFLLGLLLATEGGLYVLEIMDKYAVGYALIYIGICELLVFAYRYGVKNIRRNIKQMTGIRLSAYWYVVWLFICPVLLVFCLIFTWVDYEPLSYAGELYPDWANRLGWFLSFTSFSFVPLYAIYKLIDHYRGKEWNGLWNALVTLSAPAEDFGPAMPQYQTHGDDDVFDAPVKPFRQFSH